MEAEEQIAKEQRYCSTQWNYSVFYQDKSNKLEKEVERLKCELNREKGFSDTMKEGYQRYLRITRHLTGREMGHVQSMDRKGQLWRVSDHCKTRIEFYLSLKHMVRCVLLRVIISTTPANCDSQK